MSLFFGTTEITKLRDLAPQTGLGITDLWFGSTNVYTVWQTYEGTLPATINANGDDMKQYQIYGNTGGVGDRTENLYNKNNASMNFEGYINSTTYTVVASIAGSLSIISPVEPNTTYTIVKPATTRFRVGLFTSYPNVGDVATATFGDRNGNGMDYGSSLTFTTSNNTSYIFAFIRNYTDTQVTNEQMKNLTEVLEGETVPEFYIPNGYKLDISTSDGTTSTVTPIYIGDESLDEDEYVDYQAGKVYRRTAQLFDMSNTIVGEGLGMNGIIVPSNVSSRSDFIEVLPNTTYVRTYNMNDDTGRLVHFYNANKIYKGETAATAIPNPTLTFKTPNGAAYVLIAFPKNATQVSLIKGSTAPEEYIPYYDPQDPPVPLPALPTCDGETVVDYAGSGTVPEKVLFKYRKEGF